MAARLTLLRAARAGWASCQLQWLVDDDPDEIITHVEVWRSPTGVSDWTRIAQIPDGACYEDRLGENDPLVQSGVAWYYNLTARSTTQPFACASAVMSCFGSVVPVEVSAPGITHAVEHPPTGTVHPAGPWGASSAHLDQSPLPLGRLVADYRARAQRMHQDHVGSASLVFLRRRWGPRCQTCYSHTARVTVRAGCPECYGTGFSLGYWTPVPSVAVYRSAPPDTALTQGGALMTQIATIKFGAHPLLAAGDVFYNTQTYSCWEVDRVDPRQLQGHAYKQSCVATELPRSHSIYTFAQQQPGRYAAPEVAP